MRYVLKEYLIPLLVIAFICIVAHYLAIILMVPDLGLFTSDPRASDAEPIQLSFPSKSSVRYKKDSLSLLNLDKSNFGVNPSTIEKVIIDTILYSPDTLKLVALVVTEKKEEVKNFVKILSHRYKYDFENSFSSFNIKEKQKDVLYYEGFIMIGVRDSISDDWKIYHILYFEPYIYPKIVSIKEFYRMHLFYGIYREKLPLLSDSLKKSYIRIQYNVIDNNFWSTELWDKDELGIYNFQKIDTDTLKYKLKN